MTAQAGFPGKIEVGTNGSTYDDIGGANDVSFDDTMEELDATEFGDSNVQRIYGLGDAEFSVTANFQGSDAGQGVIRTAKAARDNIFVRYLPDGTNGWSAECLCTSISTSQSVDDKVVIEYTFVLANGSVSVE